MLTYDNYLYCGIATNQPEDMQASAISQPTYLEEIVVDANKSDVVPVRHVLLMAVNSQALLLQESQCLLDLR